RLPTDRHRQVEPHARAGRRAGLAFLDPPPRRQPRRGAAGSMEARENPRRRDCRDPPTRAGVKRRAYLRVPHRMRTGLRSGVAEAQRIQRARALGDRGQTRRVYRPLLAVKGVEEPARGGRAVCTVGKVGAKGREPGERSTGMGLRLETPGAWPSALGPAPIKSPARSKMSGPTGPTAARPRRGTRLRDPGSGP